MNIEAHKQEIKNLALYYGFSFNSKDILHYKQGNVDIIWLSKIEGKRVELAEDGSLIEMDSYLLYIQEVVDDKFNRLGRSVKMLTPELVKVFINGKETEYKIEVIERLLGITNEL